MNLHSSLSACWLLDRPSVVLNVRRVERGRRRENVVGRRRLGKGGVERREVWEWRVGMGEEEKKGKQSRWQDAWGNSKVVLPPISHSRDFITFTSQQTSSFQHSHSIKLLIRVWTVSRTMSIVVNSLNIIDQSKKPLVQTSDREVRMCSALTNAKCNKAEGVNGVVLSLLFFIATMMHLRTRWTPPHQQLTFPLLPISLPLHPLFWPYQHIDFPTDLDHRHGWERRPVHRWHKSRRQVCH